MSGQTMRCGNCLFYGPEETCRRRPPVLQRLLDFHNSEILRDIAWTLREIAKMDPPDEKGDPLHVEAPECEYDSCRCRWPYVDVDDWCGEYRPRAESGD